MFDVGGDVLAERWFEPFDVPVTISFLPSYLVRFTLVKVLYFLPVSTLSQRVIVDRSRLSEHVLIIENICEHSADRCRQVLDDCGWMV